MGDIYIEGLGIIDIKGDVPDDEETQAILSSMPDEQEIEPVIPDIQEEVIDPVEEVSDAGPIGVVPEEVRGSVRETVENQSGLLQLLAEMSPSIGGTMAGTAAGTPFGPLGMIAGAAIGGAGGEMLAQETGIAPQSDLNIGLSAGAPVVGPAVGGAFRLGRRGVGMLPSILPFARAARARNILPKAIEEYESMGTKILSEQEGLMAKPSSELYEAVKRSGVTIPQNALAGTHSAISGLVDEMKALKAFPEVKQARNVLKQLRDTIDGDISIDTLVHTRQLLGVVVRRAESGGGIKLGSAKKAFAAINDDLDWIASDPSLTGRAASLAKTAVKRAKLEFAVKDLEAGIANFIKDETTKEGVGMVTINAKGLQKWLRDISNPKSAKFDKNFVSALGDNLPLIKANLDELAKVLGNTGSGVGELVIRGRLTSMVVGGLAGMGLGGPFIAAGGALIGTRIPEMLTGILTKKSGAAFLERVVRLGKGNINTKAWILATQLAMPRSSGKDDKSRGKSDEVLWNK